VGAPRTRVAAGLPRPLVRELRGIAGGRNVLTSPADLALYAYDSSLERHAPEVVVFPASTDEVARVVRAAARFGVPFVPRGAGTNLSGGSIPVAGGIVIALSRLNRVLEIDIANRCAVVQPGVTNLALQEALAPLGWVFHPDPASQKVSTLGGNVAENAGGPHCLKYGVTTNHILGARVVLPDGEVADLGGMALDAPGYDLLGLVNGSEGTLGIVTEITARISPQPEAVRTLLGVFDSMDAASAAVSAIIAAGIIPACLEMMDRVMIGAVQASMDAGYPEDAEAVLVIEVDGLREALEQEARRCAEICRRVGAREVRSASDEREREQLWAGRRGAFGAAARLASAFLVNDGTVPRSKLPEVLRQTQEIAARYGLRVGNNFHAGDGNLHPLILLDDSDPCQRELAKRASMEMLEACIAAGGAISGEHGIGSEKRAAMPLLYSPADIAAHAAVKRAFDPRGLCNPGKILPDTLSPVRVDQAPIPPRSRAVEAPGAPEVDGRAPTACLVPESEQEVAALLAGAADERAALVPLGAGTKLGLGMPPQRFDYALSLARVAGVVEHDVENLTVTVRAGTRLADLQAELARRGQWLALDPPHEEATIGGIIAANSYGPGRMRYGACRDLVLGLRVALPSGAAISVGGKTVKNVSGYDLPKLFIGSLGTLGVITAATFKLLPAPPQTEWRAWGFARLAAAVECARQLAASRLELSAAEVFSGNLARAGEWIMLCRAQGPPAAVERQVAAAGDLCARSGGVPIDAAQSTGMACHASTPAAAADAGGGAGFTPFDPLRACPERSEGAGSELHAICRIAVPPARLFDALTAAQRLLGEGGRCAACGPCVLAASPAIGVARVAFEADGAGAAVLELRDEYGAGGGSVVIERAPLGLKIAAGVWGTEHPGARVMRALKAEFDPDGVLSPGRFAGGV